MPVTDLTNLLDVVDQHANTMNHLEDEMAGAVVKAKTPEAARALVVRGWEQGQLQGRSHAVSELKQITSDPVVLNPMGNALASSYLNEVLASVDATFANSELTDIERQRRLQAAMTVAVNRGYGDAQMSAYRDNQVTKKVWVTSFSFATCPTCAALHGTVVSVDSGFSATQSFSATPPPGVFVNLESPPRHPHCHCRIVAITEDLVPQTEAMRSYARQFATEAKGMAPRSWATGEVGAIAKSTPYMTSDDIRNIPHGHFRQAVDLFKACVVKFKRLV